MHTRLWFGLIYFYSDALVKQDPPPIHTHTHTHKTGGGWIILSIWRVYIDTFVSFFVTTFSIYLKKQTTNSDSCWLTMGNKTHSCLYMSDIYDKQLQTIFDVTYGKLILFPQHAILTVTVEIGTSFHFKNVILFQNILQDTDLYYSEEKQWQMTLTICLYLLRNI